MRDQQSWVQLELSRQLGEDNLVSSEKKNEKNIDKICYFKLPIGNNLLVSMNVKVKIALPKDKVRLLLGNHWVFIWRMGNLGQPKKDQKLCNINPF